MDQATFDAYRRIVYERAGINLTPGKESLVCARTARRMRVLGITDERDYLDYVLADDTGDEMVHLIDAISTNVTFFFREGDHFTILEQELNRLLDHGQGRLRIWSAACSSGEEPYSIAITAHELFQRRRAIGVDLKILATDLSTRVLAVAREGSYPAEKVANIHREVRQRVFQADGDGHRVTVIPELKNMIAFRRLNLASAPLPMQGPFDIVFCRNVMIYFDQIVRRQLIREIERLLRPGGLLMIGHSENLLGLGASLQPVKASVYRKPRHT